MYSILRPTVITHGIEFRRQRIRQAVQNANYWDVMYKKARVAGSFNLAQEYKQASNMWWEEVEEISSSLSDYKRRMNKDVLEKYCEEDPSALECRIYDV
jgi:hypothetical protein